MSFEQQWCGACKIVAPLDVMAADGLRMFGMQQDA
jgi:hypothetical protein